MPFKLFQFYGGKYYMIEDIFKVVSPLYYNKKITCFVDVFGGSGTVLLNVPQKWKVIRVYNDIDSVLCKVMKDLMNEETRKKIFEKLEWALRCRELFNEIKTKPYEEWDSFEYLYMIACSYNSGLKSFSISIKPRNKMNDLENSLKKNWRLLKGWIIENLDFRELIPKYDSEKTFFYLDPPYLTGGKQYKFSFTIEDFKDLKRILDSVKGYWLLNSSERDFEEIIKIFGEPKFVKEYENFFRHKDKTEFGRRKEGFWFNFEINNVSENKNLTSFLNRDNESENKILETI